MASLGRRDLWPNEQIEQVLAVVVVGPPGQLLNLRGSDKPFVVGHLFNPQALPLLKRFCSSDSCVPGSSQAKPRESTRREN